MLATIGDGRVEVGVGYGDRSAAESGRHFLIDEAL